MVAKIELPSGFNAEDVDQAISRLNLYRPNGLIRLTGGKQQSQAAYGGRTFHTTMLLPASFYATRLTLFNANNSAQSITGFEASICTSQNADSPYTPSGGESSFKQFTFADSSIPSAVAGVGNFYQGFVPGHVHSDVMFYDVPSSHVQSDGSVIAMVRNYAPTLNTGANFDEANYGGRNITIRGKTIAADRIVGGNAVGNFIQSAGSFTRLVTGAPIEPVTGAFALRMFYTKPVVTFMAVGDSTMEGVGSTSGITPSTRYACQYLLSEGYPISFYNAGFGGSSNAQSPTTESGDNAVLQTGFLAQFRRLCEIGLAPDVAAYLSLSSNNGVFKTEETAYTEDAAREAAYFTEVFLGICRQYDVRPIVVTPGPNPDIQTTQEEVYRRAAVQSVKDVCAGGRAILIDRDALFTDQGNPLGGFTDSNDSRNNSVHPSEQGHLKEAELFIDALLKIL